MEKGKLYIVGTPIGNLKDITLRALETLRSVDLIACEDTRHTLGLLTHYEIKKPLISYYKPKEREGAEKILFNLSQGKDVALIGHGERALEEALYLAPLVRKLYFLLDQDEEGSLLEGLRGRKNVEILRGWPVRIEGEGSVSALLVEAEAQEMRLPVSAVFPLSGTKSATAFLSPLPLRLEKGFVPVDENLMSELPGLFAIGDVRASRLRQAITAASDGALCSLFVRNYLRRAS